MSQIETPPKKAFVETNGLRLHYLTWRREDARETLPPVLLLHATGFLARLWQPIAEALASEYTVYAFDSRGHGDSDKPPADYHWQRFVEDLAGFMDALSLRDIPIVGHSAGGTAAAYLAGTRAGYASRLVLIEPIIRPPVYDSEQDGRASMAAAARKRRMVWDRREEMVAAYRKRPTFERWRDDMLRLYAEFGTFQREDGRIAMKCPGEIEAQIFEQSASLNTWDVLSNVTCPALVMRGALTDQFLATICAAAAQRIPNGRLHVIEGAVASEITHFLETVN